MSESYETKLMFSYREVLEVLRIYQEIMENLAGAKDKEHYSWENQVLSSGDAFSLLQVMEHEVWAVLNIKIKELEDGKPIEKINRRVFDRRKNKVFAINDYIRPLLLIMPDEERLKYFENAKEYDYCAFLNKLWNIGDGMSTRTARHLGGKRSKKTC